MTRLLVAFLLASLALPASAARVLIVGDSHTVGPFGTALDEGLRAAGDRTTLYAVCGASSSWWLGPKRAKLSICWSIHGEGGKNSPQSGANPELPPTARAMLAARPDTVIFALGSNADGSAAETAAAAGRLLALLDPGTRCVWVGPPPMPKRLAFIDAFYRELPKVLTGTTPPCELIDSRTLIKPADAAANDHFYGPPAVAWGRAVAAKLAP